MTVKREIPGKATLDKIASDKGVAIAVVDRDGIEIVVSNDNSICASLNPDGELTGACKADCDRRALERASQDGGVTAFTCHAGLDCRATALDHNGQPVAVIVGRSFLRSDNYRRAGERAISGDWSHFPPAQFFENILLSGSATIMEEAMNDVVKNSVEIVVREPKPRVFADGIAARAAEINSATAKFPGQEPHRETPSDPAPWRAFLGSLLGRDHASARDGMIEFLTEQFGLKSIVLLETRGERLESIAVSGPLKKRRIRLGIAADDERLRDAATSEMPVELGQKATPQMPDPQRMLLFALPVGSEIPAAIVVMDTVADIETRRQIARLCHTVAPQLELLRLRGEFVKREMLDAASRKVTDGLRDIEAADFWTYLTRVSAELLQAERASLITRDGDSEQLEVRAAIGTPNDLTHEKNAGERVARIVFEKGKPVVVTDVAATGLPPADAERRYKTPSFLSAPVSYDGRQIAVINFTDKASGGAFDRSDLDMVKAITPQIASAIDRTQLKEKAGEFEQLSVTDSLTGLLNRRYIEQRLAEEVKRSNRHGYPMSFIMLDVDHFKSYNDGFGHPAGDEALRLVSGVIGETLRGADIAARFGGEEFAILLPQTTDEEAAAIAERVRYNIETTQFPHREVTVSMGVASCSSELCSTMDMVGAADKALYAAKAAGRNRVCIYQEIAEKQVA